MTVSYGIKGARINRFYCHYSYLLAKLKNIVKTIFSEWKLTKTNLLKYLLEKPFRQFNIDSMMENKTMALNRSN